MKKSPAKPAKPSLGELGLIGQIRSARQTRSAAPRCPRSGATAAILRPPRGYEILVTTDFTLEDRHFRRALHPPESVGHRCLARGLSDLAAMGATPLAAFLSLALPAKMLMNRKIRPTLDRRLPPRSARTQ